MEKVDANSFVKLGLLGKVRAAVCRAARVLGVGGCCRHCRGSALSVKAEGLLSLSFAPTVATLIQLVHMCAMRLRESTWK